MNNEAEEYEKKLKLRAQAQRDQEIREACAAIPRMWRTMYNECIECGFTREETMDLLKTYIQTALTPPR
jgi:RNA polymerase-binding transcription factor DksA